MPMNDRYAVADVLDALHQYPLPKRRRITIEYTLLAGVNDAIAQARELARRLRGLRVKVNLIPMNPITGSDLEAPSPGRVEAFREVLAGEGFSVFVRKQRGDDVDAACGQLVLKERLTRKVAKSECSDASS
jgi:23S rRNA (adenine2503-C2)-methyltransferase